MKFVVSDRVKSVYVKMDIVMMRQPTNTRNFVASTLIDSPLWAKAPLTIQRLWQSYSVASYIPLF